MTDVPDRGVYLTIREVIITSYYERGIFRAKTVSLIDNYGEIIDRGYGKRKDIDRFAQRIADKNNALLTYEDYNDTRC